MSLDFLWGNGELERCSEERERTSGLAGSWISAPNLSSHVSRLSSAQQVLVVKREADVYLRQEEWRAVVELKAEFPALEQILLLGNGDWIAAGGAISRVAFRSLGPSEKKNHDVDFFYVGHEDDAEGSLRSILEFFLTTYKDQCFVSRSESVTSLYLAPGVQPPFYYSTVFRGGRQYQFVHRVFPSPEVCVSTSTRKLCSLPLTHRKKKKVSHPWV